MANEMPGEEGSEQHSTEEIERSSERRCEPLDPTISQRGVTGSGSCMLKNQYESKSVNRICSMKGRWDGWRPGGLKEHRAQSSIGAAQFIVKAH